MKVNVSSVARIQSARAYTQIELIAATRPVTGKSAVVEVSDSANGSALIAAAESVLKITPPAGLVKVMLIVNGAEVDESLSLASLGLKDGSSAQVRFYVQIA
jgi:hypothetical protein